MRAKPHIVVAGGGIGGLGAALGLIKAGCRVTVLEQADAFGEIGAGIQIGPNAFHALDYLGVGEACRKKAVLIDKLIMMDGVSANKVTEIPVDEPFRKRFGNPYAVIHRADLHSVLLNACKTHPHIQLVTSQKAREYENSATGARLHTESGATFDGDAIIGADGIYSTIRERMTGGDTLQHSGHVAYRAVLPIEDMPADLRWNAATIWVGPKCHLVHYPLQGWKSFNIVATFVTDISNMGSNEPGDREEVLSQFGAVADKPRDLLEKPTAWRRWALADRDPIDNWIDGNVLLLGDAAHPTYQYFAQGACMALEDAVCLSDQVEKHGHGFTAAFQAYQEIRMIRAYRVVLSSRELGRLYHASGVERKIRNAVLGARTPDEFYNSLAWLYGGNGLKAIASESESA